MTSGSLFSRSLICVTEQFSALQRIVAGSPSPSAALMRYPKKWDFTLLISMSNFGLPSSSMVREIANMSSNFLKL